ncbi:hypothetical protein [Streptomyces sp. NRRL S-118]|uniref:hypothetical protein n=1 Tax=Streptomyces sp. NRRL S-118 TaxID=1463881 RepID=UPI0004C4875B|nr:hypothetical protein [Streptomyces sp. NRRL S-118]
MQRTRIPAKVLTAVAMAAAASGCVSVQPPPGPGPAAPEASRPVQDVAPQIVEGPAREALEAALPPAPTDSPRVPAARPGHPVPGTGGGAPHDDDRPPRPPRAPGGPAVDRPREQLPQVRPPAPPSVPVTLPDVCALGEDYGGWQPGSQESRTCRGTYRR